MSRPKVKGSTHLHHFVDFFVVIFASSKIVVERPNSRKLTVYLIVIFMKTFFSTFFKNPTM